MQNSEGTRQEIQTAPKRLPRPQGERGFSLVELMVSVTLFVVVMLVAVGALLSLVEANRKARALESVMNNLNIALDGMVRSIRMGNTFNCGANTIPDPVTGADCAGGDDRFSFAAFGSNPEVQGERWVYYFQDNQLWRSRQGGANAIAITAPEVHIDDVTFYVVGTARANANPMSPNTTQPKVVMVIKGTAGREGTRSETSFYIQATAVQRVLDL